MVVMQLSARGEHALRALMELAAAGDGALVPSGQLTRNQAVPGRQLELIMTELRRAGLVHSKRGAEGGYSLARPADQLSLADIATVICGPRLGSRD
jgi:Rrf2 family protein